MKKICNDSSHCIFYFLQVMNRIFRKTIKETITKLYTGMNKSISYYDSICFRDKRTNATEITKLDEARFNNRLDVFIHEHISLKNYTKVFCIINKRNSIRTKINIINRKMYIIWIKQEIFSFIWINR